ncbi:PepSY domain-containing protein [Micrococcus sp.]|uniref:PepSY domain-containing protein n=1 Tax=Micrococcus sp. TaxID=1271 RepID=UPI0026DB71DA|nr:PepSY domain-containing protein [Micrococcus sp.]MDO4240561.1 PepSY domain-containing protein [Micrococcus sp.]
MADLKKTLSLSAGALLAMTALAGCGTDAEDAAQSASAGAQSAASSAASAATSAAAAASSAITDDDDSSSSAAASSTGATGSATSSAAGSSSAAAAGGVADPQGAEGIKALQDKYPNGTVISLDRDDDDAQRWEADVVVDGKVQEVEVAADGTLTEKGTDSDKEDVDRAGQATVTAQQAVEKAVEGRDGQVVDDVELDEENGTLTWKVSFDDDQRRDLEEVRVDAKSGDVVGVEKD